jgi:hypothetical protein
MTEPIRIKRGQIVKDIRSEMARSELMGKYRLTWRSLRWVLIVLIKSGVISWKEIHGRLISSQDELLLDGVRRARRYLLPFDVSVHELNHPDPQGKLRNISETGVAIIGITGTVGETKTLVVSGDDFGEFGTFFFEAECRWCKKAPNGQYVTGFEISHMSLGNMAEFRILMRLV